MNYRFLRWCKGYVEVEIKGSNKERFINLCGNNKLYIYNIVKREDIYTFSMDIEAYKSVKKIAKKAHVFPRIKNKCGLPFVLNKLEERKSFTIGIFISIFIFYICSLFVWDIKIEGENYYTDYELLNFLESQNIKYGMRVKEVVCKDIEDSIRKKYSDIGWVSAQVKGTRLIIAIKENVKFNNKKADAEKSRHIISTVDGKVKSIVVKQGEPVVNVGDTVEKGQILVSGIKEIKNDAGEIIKKYGVYSEGDITIASDKEYYYEVKKKYNKLQYTGENKIKWSININNSKQFIISLPSFGKKIDNFDVIVNNYNVSLGENLPLPIIINKYMKREYKLEEEVYTNKELLAQSQKHYNNYSEELKKEKTTIIKHNIQNIIDDTRLYSKGYVTLLFGKMEYKDVEESELEITDVAEMKNN